jgi:hypothetical protein
MINWPIEIKQNKYTRWYEALIVKAKTRDPLDGYKEKHHIIPNSLIKNKDVVELTAREHYVAHLLLWRMDMPPKWHNKMSMALHVMVNGSGHKKQDRNYLVSSRIYESARVSVITAMKEYFAEHGGTMTGKKHTAESLEKMRAWQNVPEIKQQQRERILGEKNHMFGKTHSEEMRKQISESVAASWNDEMKEEKSKWLTEQWQDPEYKKKMIDIRKNSEGWLNRDWSTANKKAAESRKRNGTDKRTPEQRKKMSDIRKARLASGEIVPWNKGLKGGIGNPKIWEVVDPNNKIFIVTDGIQKFCKQQGISYDTLGALAKNTPSRNKLRSAGWKARILPKN